MSCATNKALQRHPCRRYARRKYPPGQWNCAGFCIKIDAATLQAAYFQKNEHRFPLIHKHLSETGRCPSHFGCRPGWHLSCPTCVGGHLHFVLHGVLAKVAWLNSRFSLKSSIRPYSRRKPMQVAASKSYWCLLGSMGFGSMKKSL